MAHLSLLSRAGLSLTVLAQPGLQARVEALVQVSELRHLIENSLDLTTGQNWLGGPGGGPQSLHGLEQKIKQVKCWWQEKVRKKKTVNIHSHFRASLASTLTHTLKPLLNKTEHIEHV